MSPGRRRLGKGGFLLLLFGILCAVLTAVAAPSAAEDGAVGVAAVVFAFSLLFVFFAGTMAYWRVRKRGIVRRRKVALGVAGICLLAATAIMAVALALPGSLNIDLGPDYPDSASGYILATLILFVVFLMMGLLMIVAACGMMWLFSESEAYLLPRFLARVKRARFDKDDAVLTRISAWLLDVPWVLDPGSMELDALPRESFKRRWYEAVVWQMAVGLLLGVYISLNPVLLQSMDYTQTFGLVSLASLVIPVLVLPWSTLEVLGARIKGVRYDFPLHEGAKARMLQTMVALGTIFLIVRLAIEDVGAETIAWRFAGYAFGLLLLSSLVSFVYFNYFERDLLSRLRQGLKERGVA